MKSLLFAALAMSFSAAVYASDCHTGHDKRSGRCNDEKLFTCFVQDSTGAQYSQYSNGWLSETLSQYKAFKKCKAQSPAPATCKPLGCQDKY